MFLLKKNSGFTLIEITVALFVFMIFTTFILTSVLRIIGTQIEANRYRATYSELNDVVTLISTDVRELALDYQCFEAGELCAADISGRTVAFIAKNGLERRVLQVTPRQIDDVEAYAVSYQIQRRVNIDLPWPAFRGQELFSDSVLVKNFDFNLFPLEDPYSPDLDVNLAQLYQPQLSLRVEVQPVTYPGREPIKLETTISSRVYNIRSR